MSFDIGPKVGIEGEAKFKDAIKGINAQIRTLGTEMKVATSQYERNDKSVEALSDQNKVLEKQLVVQKQKLNEASQALAFSTQKYGENDKVTLEWQRTVNLATAEINNLDRKLKNNTKAIEEAQNPTEELSDEVKRFGSNADVAGEKALSMGDIIKANLISKAIIDGVKALGSALASVGKKAIDSAKEAGVYADTYITLSETTGMSTEKLQEFAYMAELTDVSVDTMTKAMTRNIRSMQDAFRAIQKAGGANADFSTITNKSAQAYHQLGISLTDTNGELRDQEEVFWELIDAMGEMENETERDAIAMELMGRSARDLAPLMNLGADAIAEYAQEAHDAGAIMSDEMLESMGEFDDAMQRLDRSTEILTRTMGTIFAPAIEGVATSITGYMTKVSVGIQEAEGDVEQIGIILGDTLSEMLADLIEKAPQMIDGAIALIQSLLNGIISQMPEIVDMGLTLILTLANSLIENLPLIVETGLSAILSLAKGIGESLPELIPVLVETILTIYDVLIENIPMMIDAALAIIVGLAEGIINSLPVLLDKVPDIIEGIIVALMSLAPQLIVAGIELVIALVSGFFKDPFMFNRTAIKIVVAIAKGLVDGAVNVVASVAELGKEMVKAFGKVNLKDVGKNIIKSLIDGFFSMTNWIGDKIKGIGDTITGGFKKIFGIKSPSTVFAGMGTNLGEGLVVGFTDEMKDASKVMAKAVPTDFSSEFELVGGVRNGGINYNLLGESIASAFARMNFEVRVGETTFGELVSSAVSREVFA